MERDRSEDVEEGVNQTRSGGGRVDSETERGIELCIKSQEILDSLLEYPPRLGETDTTSLMELVNFANISMGAVVIRLREDPEAALPDAEEMARRAAKHMLARLHPDREDGDAELYKIASSVYETLKRDRVDNKREEK